MICTQRRTLPVLLAAATLLPIGALGWLGFHIIRQDRELERQRRRESLEAAAGRVALTLERRLGEIEEKLAQGHGLHLVATGLTGEGVLYSPDAPPVRGAREGAFSEAEALEFQRRDLAAAAAAYKRLAELPDLPVRAGALVRLGRVLRKQGDRAQAVQVYGELQQLGSTPVSGQPAELLALHGRCRLWEEAGDGLKVRKAASDLAQRLYAGVWPVDRATFEMYSDAVRAWGGPPPPANAVARTEAAISLWKAARAGDLQRQGRRIVREGSTPVLAVWTEGPAGPVAWIGMPGDLQVPTPADLAISLQDSDGQPVLGRVREGAAVLAPGDTRLPFIVRVAPAAAHSDYGVRHRFLIAALLVTLALILATGYGLYRVTTREMALVRQQSDFVSAVSHEFRTPLTSMRHLTDMLVSRNVPGEERKAHYYKLLAREIERLHRMVESLLSFGRIEAGAYAWHLEPADPSALVREAVQDFRAEPPAAGRELLCEIEDGLPLISADREALSRAMWNLLENAAKYSAPDTSIRVFARRSGDAILLGVADRGTGIAPAEQTKVFDKFVRGAAAKRAGVRGVGIGLALVKRIAEAHGGSVRLYSEPGRGSTFTLVMPCHES